MPDGPAWGPETCAGCGVGLPPGLVMLDRDRHVDCEEARKAWQNMQETGKKPRMLPPRR